MEDWTRSEVLALMGFLVALIGAIAAAVVVKNSPARTILILALIVIALITAGILLNSNLKKETSKEIIVQENRQMNVSSISTPLPQPSPIKTEQTPELDIKNSNGESQTQIDSTPQTAQTPNEAKIKTPSKTPDVQIEQLPKSVTFIKSLDIPANKMWFDTGIDVTGKTVRIEYKSGKWSNGGSIPFYADGRGSDSWEGVLVPNAPIRALVGKTSNGTFFVGNLYEGEPGRERLYLSINDIPNTYDDNIGALKVLVSFVE